MTDVAPEAQSESFIYRGPHAQADADSITLLRILDVLYALLGKSDPKQLKKLADLHATGGILGPNVNFDPSKNLDQPSED